MSDETAKLKLKKPWGSETVNRAAYNENLDLIDQNAVAEQFYLKSAVYNPSGPSIDLVIGPGRAQFVTTVAVTTTDTNYSIPSPLFTQDYWVFIKKDGTFAHNSMGVMDEAVRLWVVSIDTPESNVSKSDRRGHLPGAGANEAYNVIEKIDGHTISSIFESDGVTAKAATTAVKMDGVRVRAYVSGNYSHTANTEVHYNAENQDPKGVFDTNTHRCTPGPGTYLVSAQLKVGDNGAGALMICKNGTTIAQRPTDYFTTTPNGSDVYANVITLVKLNDSADYISIKYNSLSTAYVIGASFESFLDIVQIA